MFHLGILSPILEDETQFISFNSDTLVGTPPALSYPRLPRMRSPFCSSMLEQTESGAARRTSLLRSGVAL